MARGAVLQRSRKNKAIKLFQAGQFEEARHLLEGLCRPATSCRDAEVWCLLGAIHGELKDYASSRDCCRQAVTLQPDYVDAHYNLAQAYMQLGRYDEAVEAYRRVVQLQPQHAHACNALGLALDRTGRHKDAFNWYQTALRQNPASIDALLNLASSHNSLGDFDAGTAYVRRALSIDPGHFQARIALGSALVELGDLEAAMACFTQANEIQPGHTDVTLGMATIEEKRGNTGRALALIQPLLETERESRVVSVFIRIARHSDRCQEAIAMAEQVLAEQGDCTSSELTSLHFQLGKLYDRTGDYGRAFGHFQAANKTAPQSRYADDFIADMDYQQQNCTAEFFRTATRSGNASDAPIFIVGMPRSGTTLTEQILASHPAVYAGGERKDIGGIADRLRKLAGGQPFPDSVRNVDARLLGRLAREYLDKVATEAGGMRRITDKMPHNFEHLGLIALLFPQARIIHCKRNPLDTCLSIYTFQFNRIHTYASDLRELGRHYRKYQQLMAHWLQVLPLSVHEASYEAMVADQEAQTRQLLAFCGLPWDETCLEFYKNRRIVNTISYSQVRKPIYSGSVERWRHYAAYLKPLQQALEG